MRTSDTISAKSYSNVLRDVIDPDLPPDVERIRYFCCELKDIQR